MPKTYNRLDKANAAVLLVDHQTGFLSLVRATSTRTRSRTTSWRSPISRSTSGCRRS
jgi:nicotinamidase-related amidase